VDSDDFFLGEREKFTATFARRRKGVVEPAGANLRCSGESSDGFGAWHLGMAEADIRYAAIILSACSIMGEER